MRNLLNPKWLFVVNTLPILVLFSLFWSQYSIIKSLLEEDNLRLWQTFSVALGTLGTLSFLYAFYLTLRKQSLSFWFGVIALPCYISFIYLYGHYSDRIIPFSIPRWMLSGSNFLHVGTFLMPTLVHALFTLIAHFTPETKEHKPGINFIIAVSIPAAAYLFSQLILPLWQPVEDRFFIHAMTVLIIVGTVIFLFFLIRGIFILAIKKVAIWQKYQLAWKIPITIVLPLIGLLINNGRIDNGFGGSASGIFGNFSDPWFYILAVVNGTLVCLPNPDRKIYRLLLFIGRSITFAYTLYFFLVFLPFLPVSVFAIIAIGTGFLLLTPLLLFVIHADRLAKDFVFLKNPFSARLLLVVSLAGFALIPAGVTVSYLHDAHVLNETLSYLYTPDYTKKYDIDKVSLQKTLRVISGHKDLWNNGMFGGGTPYLSAYFNWLVLDNLTLSDARIHRMEKVFFGQNSFQLPPENIRNQHVVLTDIASSSTYDPAQKVWKSWVNLEITNQSDESWFAEYATTIELPAGCWVSDYYLYVGDQKEPGILAEKKAAMWVFSQIRGANRDPGILYYLTGNNVAFRVFPFAKEEVRRTGIEFLHKEPISLTIDGQTIALGEKTQEIDGPVETENVIYISAQQKQKLKAVKRSPYFHFLVDVSNGKKERMTDWKKRMEQLVTANPSLSTNAKISFINTYVHTFSLAHDWKTEWQAQGFEGGFYLDRAIKKSLRIDLKSSSYPVLVVVTDSIQEAILDKDFSDFSFAFPESNLFYELADDGALTPHSLTKTPLIRLPDSTNFSFDYMVLAYPLPDGTTAYLPDNGEPSICLKQSTFDVSEQFIQEKSWLSGLSMQGQWMSQTLHPERSATEWLKLVKHSFLSKIMTPVTSYLVVENEAQKAILKKKQEQVLSGNHSLDLGEDMQRMSEPGLWGIAVLLLLILWYREKRKRRNQSFN